MIHQLFLCLQVLISEECDTYLADYGFTVDTSTGRTDPLISLHPQAWYFGGRITYPIITTRPKRGKCEVFLRLHELFVENFGEIVVTRDNPRIHTPRMSDARRVYQPYHQMKAISNVEVDSETSNHLATRLRRALSLVTKIAGIYNNKFRHLKSTGAYGTTAASMSSLMGLFTGYTPAMFNSIGMRGHCEMFHLRRVYALASIRVICELRTD